MPKDFYSVRRSMTLLLVLLVAMAALPAAAQNNADTIDLTAGGERPEGSTHDWNLGATGARGWIHSRSMETRLARQILVTRVADDTPAAGRLQAGDVILGIDGELFDDDPRILFGQALTRAESTRGQGRLALTVWRGGNRAVVSLQLPVLGDYSDTAPFDCPKSDAIVDRGCESLAQRMLEPGYRANPIVRSLNALALLASGDRSYLPLIEREARWAAEFESTGFQTWYYGYTTIFLAEYIMATGDEAVMEGLTRQIDAAVTGQSTVGSWGHRFASEGQLFGYGMMHAPGVPLTIGLVLSRTAGVEHDGLDDAIQLSVDMIRFYVGKGSIPYGDHSPWMQTHDDNGKNGSAAVLFNLLGDAEATEYFSRMSVATHGSRRDEGHTGNFLNMLWALPGVAQSGPQASGAWMDAFGGYYFDLARTHNDAFVHLGPAKETNDSYHNWDCSGAYLLALAIPRGNLAMTNPQRDTAPQIDRDTAESLIEDGVGWYHGDRNTYYDAMTPDQLIERLNSWSPVVRQRAAMAIGRINPPAEGMLQRLIEMLGSDDLYTQLGACRGLQFMRGDRSAAVPELVRVFGETPDMWLRIHAADALAGIGGPAREAIPMLLQRLVAEPDPALDPRGMEQRYLMFALFNQRGGLIGRSLEGVDREALQQAVLVGLRNQDGRARGTLASVYSNLTFEEIRPLLPAIRDAIVQMPPSGIMFSGTIRMAGLELLARHHVDEGIELILYYARNQRGHGSQQRLPQVLTMLESYGVHAQRVIPELEILADYYENDNPGFPRRLSLVMAERTRLAIERIRNADTGPDLVEID